MFRYILATAALAASSTAHAAWDFKVLVDPMTDAQRGIASLMGENGALVVKCDSNGAGSLYISVISDRFLGGTSRSRSRDINFRFDGGEVQKIAASHDGSTASFFNLKPGSRGGAFLAQLADSSRLVLQVSSYNYHQYTIILDTSGAREAIASAASTCGDTDWAAM